MLDWAMTHPSSRRSCSASSTCSLAAATTTTCSGTCRSTSTACPYRGPSSSVSTSPSRCRSARRLGGGRAAQRPPHGAPVHRRRGSRGRAWRACDGCGTRARRSPSTSSARRSSATPKPSDYAERVVELLDVLSAGTPRGRPASALERDPWGALPRVNVSVKPTALSPLFAPLTGRGGVGRGHGADAPDARSCTPATGHGPPRHRARRGEGPRLRAAPATGREYPDVQLGCVVQAYRKDSYADLRDLVAWSATDLRGPAAGAAGEGRLLGSRGDRRRRRGLAVCRCSRRRRRPTRTSSAARSS